MRLEYPFSDRLVAAIAAERYRHPDPRVREQMEILWLKSLGETHDRIAVVWPGWVPTASVTRPRAWPVRRRECPLRSVRWYTQSGECSESPDFHGYLQLERAIENR